MRALRWLALVCIVWGCGGSEFTSAGGGGSGGSASGSASGGSSDVGGGEGGSDSGAPATGGTSGTGAGGLGGIGVAGSLPLGGSLPWGGEPGAAGGTSEPVDRACPRALPGVEGACEDGLVCTYGVDPRPECRPRAECMNGRWRRALGGDCAKLTSCGKVEANVACDAAESAPCILNGDTYCVCTGCSGAGPCSTETSWQCAPSQGDAECPQVLPNHGQACQQSASCSYGSCATGNSVLASCDGAEWRWEEVACPL